MEDYTDQYLISSSDCELFCVHQLQDILFCVQYSGHHEVYSFALWTLADIEKWGYSIPDYEPSWMDYERIKDQSHMF